MFMTTRRNNRYEIVYVKLFYGNMTKKTIYVTYLDNNVFLLILKKKEKIRRKLTEIYMFIYIFFFFFEDHPVSKLKD